jgi:peptidyl-prolyl cis-trans isomerase B (cyclophilin B)
MKHLIFLWLLLTIAPSWAKDVPVIELQTNLGKIVLELNPQQAPKTVENFLAYAKSGFYEGTIFHRVIKDFMIQGGGYTKDFTKKPTRPPIPNEANNGLKNRKGTVAMARTGDPNSANSQFFINMSDNHFLDHRSPTPEGWGYAVFGQVTQGMEVLNEIQAIKTGAQGPFLQDVPEKTVIIQKVIVTQATPTSSSETAKKGISGAEKPRVEDKVKAEIVLPQETPPANLKAKAAGSAEGQSVDQVKERVSPSSALTEPKEEVRTTEPAESKTEVTTKMAIPERKLPKENAPSDQSAIMAPDAPSKPDEPEPPPS